MIESPSTQKQTAANERKSVTSVQRIIVYVEGATDDERQLLLSEAWGGMKQPIQIAQALARIESLEAAIRIAKEYLESGEHADWSAFRPLFNPKLKDGKELPPHKDWVKNVYLRQMERRLSKAEKTLWELERKDNPPSAH